MPQITSMRVQEYLAGMEYPATKDDLIKYARTKNAPDEVINTLDNLPEDESFENPTQVAEALEDITLDIANEEEEEEDKETSA